MADGVERDRSAGFGSLVRVWRDRSTPVAPGTTTGSRRAPGLRREELATLAGISVDYLVQLEQGRASRPSPAVVAALCRALGLRGADAAVLHQAAGLAAPVAPMDREVPAGIERLVARADAWPAAAYSADWWLLRWNDAWAALMGDPARLVGRARNQVWHEMTEDTSSVWVDAGQRERYRDALVEDLRAARAAHPDDGELDELVRDLREVSADFAARWQAARPATYRGARKQVRRPVVGLMTLDGDVVRTPGSDVRLVLYSAEPGSPDEAALRRLVDEGRRDRAGASPEDR